MTLLIFAAAAHGGAALPSALKHGCKGAFTVAAIIGASSRSAGGSEGIRFLTAR